MTDQGPKAFDEKLEAYLDRTMSPRERQEYEQALEDGSLLAEQFETQRRIDASIRRMFSPPTCASANIERLIAADAEIETRTPATLSPAASSKHNPRRKRIVLGAAAVTALVAWALVVWQWPRRAEMEPFFEPRPVAEIYQEAVRSGFQPYYFCEDESRFAETFRKRQSVPLRLASLPEGRRMIGLSYLGGLSRDTTAMLCEVDGMPVIVFVDRLERDRSDALANEDSGLHVFRQQLGPLVLYEVTPLEQPRVVEYLAPG